MWTIELKIPEILGGKSNRTVIPGKKCLKTSVYILQACPIFRQFGKNLFHSSAKISRNSNHNISLNGKCPKSVSVYVVLNIKSVYEILELPFNEGYWVVIKTIVCNCLSEIYHLAVLCHVPINLLEHRNDFPFPFPSRLLNRSSLESDCWIVCTISIWVEISPSLIQ